MSYAIEPKTDQAPRTATPPPDRVEISGQWVIMATKMAWLELREGQVFRLTTEEEDNVMGDKRKPYLIPTFSVPADTMDVHIWFKTDTVNGLKHIDSILYYSSSRHQYITLPLKK
jgi:hypothetical protein